MDPDKLVRFVAENASEYVRAFFAILQAPRMYFVHDSSPSKWAAQNRVLVAAVRDHKPLLNPHLFFFAAISILVATAFWNVMGIKDDSVLARVLVVLAFWVALAVLAHVTCRIVGGRGSFEDSLSATIQVFAVSYVVSAVLTLILASFRTTTAAAAWASSYVFFVAALPPGPNQIYFLLQFVLLAAYLPANLRSVHRLPVYRIAPVIAVPITVLVIAPAMVVRIGGPPPIAPPDSKAVAIDWQAARDLDATLWRLTSLPTPYDSVMRMASLLHSELHRLGNSSDAAKYILMNDKTVDHQGVNSFNAQLRRFNRMSWIVWVPALDTLRADATVSTR